MTVVVAFLLCLVVACLCLRYDCCLHDVGWLLIVGVLGVVRCALFVVCCMSWFVLGCLFCAGCDVLCGVCCALLVVVWCVLAFVFWSCVVCGSLCVVCCSLQVCCCLLDCVLLFVACCLVCVACWLVCFVFCVRCVVSRGVCCLV